MSYKSVKIEGGILSPTILDTLERSPYKLKGQKPEDFGFKDEQSFRLAVYEAWEDALRYWEAFERRLKRESGESITTITREQWAIPFLETLGFKLVFQKKWEEVDGKKYPISHRAGEWEEAPPVHIVGCDQELGNRPPSGKGTMSPHALLQEYLNKTEHLWGIVTNGYVLRILRDSYYFSKPSYIEFDLRQIMEGRLLNEFFLLYRLVHRSRFPKGMSDAPECLLEYYHKLAIEEGGRIRDGLRDAVENAIKHFANGFLRHPKNEFFREKIRKGELSAHELYRELLYLVYRILFLSVAEDRNQIRDERGIYKYLSLSRLRELLDKRTGYEDKYHDLYLGLRTLFYLLRSDEKTSLVGFSAVDGQLFAELENLDRAYLTNKDLLEAVRYLTYFTPKDENVIRRINYSQIDVEEFGSVYESLLDYEPVIREEDGRFVFDFREGVERKSTGSYYTPHVLVKELVSSALVPVLEEKLRDKNTKEEKEKAILSIKVCDPASGSGHFLLEAARYLGKELAKVRTESDEPPPEEIRKAIRDVISHCIYGVDKNPLAVDLCKVALWIEGNVTDMPLTFLDHKIKCGDSLVGVFKISALREGIPEGAYRPVSGDDKNIAKAISRENRIQIRGQKSLFKLLGKSSLDTHPLAEGRRMLEEIPEQKVEDVKVKEGLYKDILESNDYRKKKLACDLWTAAFFAPLTRENFERDLIPTTEHLYAVLENKGISPELEKFVSEISEKHRFFHWELEFPEVFEEGGFDVILGNPPWEKVKLQEKEFFATRAPEIAQAPNSAARKKMIKELPEKNPALWHEYQDALRTAESISLFLRESGFYPLTGRGDINTYSVFAERMRALLKPGGRVGIIVPTGIATDDTNKHFFADLVDSGGLVSLYDFENREGIFPHVDRRYKFCLLTIQKPKDSEDFHKVPEVRLAFFLTRTEHMKDNERIFTFSPEDIARINPNTRTLPVFRTCRDTELTKFIYKRVPVLINEQTGENPWGVRFLAMFHMSNDSHLFRTRKELEDKGYQLIGNRFVKGKDIWLPLYEAKMIWHYDHRFGTYEGFNSRSSTHLPTPTESQHADPTYLVQPWYWVPVQEVEARLKGWELGWLIGWRGITNATNERTMITNVFPRSGAGDTLLLMFPDHKQGATRIACLVADQCTIVHDYVTRQKIGGTHLKYHVKKQLPILPPTAYTEENLLFIVPRVLELVYTAWDIKPFADDVWREADESLREAIRRQWAENTAQTGGHRWEIPNWAKAYPEINWSPEEGIPFPPFKWDEKRRARLRAELDAYYARLYGLSRKQLRYILDPADLTERELEDILDPWEEVTDPLDPEGYFQRVESSTFPGETFRVLKEKELREYGEYRTRRLVLEAWETIARDKVFESKGEVYGGKDS